MTGKIKWSQGDLNPWPPACHVVVLSIYSPKSFLVSLFILFTYFCTSSEAISGSIAFCFSPICLKYFLSLLSGKPATAISAIKLNNKPPKNQAILM